MTARPARTFHQPASDAQRDARAARAHPSRGPDETVPHIVVPAARRGRDHDHTRPHADHDDQPIDLYAILGLTRDATQAQISHAYRTLLRRYHPDTRTPGDRSHDAASDAALQHVLTAYAVLRDPARRADYDQQTTPRSAPTSHTSTPIHAVMDTSVRRSTPPRRTRPLEPLAHLNFDEDARAVRAEPGSAGPHVENARPQLVGNTSYCLVTAPLGRPVLPARRSNRRPAGRGDRLVRDCLATTDGGGDVVVDVVIVIAGIALTAFALALLARKARRGGTAGAALAGAMAAYNEAWQTTAYSTRDAMPSRSCRAERLARRSLAVSPATQAQLPAATA